MFRFLVFIFFLLNSGAVFAQSLNDKIKECDLAYFEACETIVAEITKHSIPDITGNPLLQFYQIKLQAAQQFQTSTYCPGNTCDFERQKHRRTVGELSWPFGSLSLDDLLNKYPMASIPVPFSPTTSPQPTASAQAVVSIFEDPLYYRDHIPELKQLPFEEKFLLLVTALAVIFSLDQVACAIFSLYYGLYRKWRPKRPGKAKRGSRIVQALRSTRAAASAYLFKPRNSLPVLMFEDNRTQSSLPGLYSSHRIPDSMDAHKRLRLAYSYISEVGPNAFTPNVPQDRWAALNTLALASMQLEKAGLSDPLATLDVDGQFYTQPTLQALALFHQGFCSRLDNPRKAAGLLQQAADLSPSIPSIWFWLGSAHMMAYNRLRARRAFHHGLILNPDDMEMAKGYDRAANMSTISMILGKLALNLYLSMNVIAWLLFGLSAFFTVSLVNFILGFLPRGTALIPVAFLFGAILLGVFQGLWLRGLYQFLGVFGFDPRDKHGAR